MAPEKRFQAVFYRASDGSEPVAEHIARQPVRTQVVLDNLIGRLNELSPSNPHLPYPWSSQVRGEIRELRGREGTAHHRILFARSRDLNVLLHAVVKRSRKLPDEDIEIASVRWADFQARMTAQPRRRPRPAGHDAPKRTRKNT